MPIKVVTFDFWGTLYHNKLSLKHERKDRIQQMFARSGIVGITDAMIYQAMEKSWVVWDDIWRTQYRTLPVHEFMELVFGELQVRLDAEVMDELCEILQQAVFTGNTLPVDHVVEAVATLSATRRLGVISDTGVSSGRYLQQLLDRDHPARFAFGLYSDELGMSKPAPGVFQKVLDMNGCRPEEVVHIGDLRYTDVLGAHQAGMHTIRYAGIRDDRTEGYPEADWVITDYRELVGIIEGIA